MQATRLPITTTKTQSIRYDFVDRRERRTYFLSRPGNHNHDSSTMLACSGNPSGRSIGLLVNSLQFSTLCFLDVFIQKFWLRQLMHACICTTIIFSCPPHTVEFLVYHLDALDVSDSYHVYCTGFKVVRVFEFDV